MIIKSQQIKHLILPLLILCAITFLNVDKFGFSIIKAFIHITIQSVFLYSLLFIFRKSYLIRLLISVIYTIELFTQLSYGTSLSISIVMSVLNTSSSESLSFIQFNLIPMIISISLFISIIFLKTPINKITNKKTALTGFFVGLTYIVMPTFASQQISLTSKNFINYSKTGLARGQSQSITIVEYYLKDMIFRLRVLPVILGISDTFYFLSFQSNTSSAWSEVTQNSLKNNNLLVIGLGESLRADNMGIYGYSKDTTPKLSSMDKLNIYKNTYAAGTNTWSSVPASLTKVSKQARADHSLSIVNLAKDAGYKVYWLSNQLKTSKWDFSVSAIAKQSDYIFFISDDEAGSEYDLSLVTKLKEILTRSEEKKIKKKLFILHFYGSHMNFTERYPPKFSIFKEDIEDNSLNNYDNSIIYTDFVQHELLELVSVNKGKYLFFADHGLIKPNGELPLKHDVRNKPDIDSIKVPFFTSVHNDALHVDTNKPVSLFYFECIFSRWSGINARELSDKNYCNNALNKETINYFDANLILNQNIPVKI